MAHKPDILFFEWLLKKYGFKKDDKDDRRQIHNEISGQELTPAELEEHVKAYAILKGIYYEQ